MCVEDKEIVNLLLLKESEITNKIHNTVSEIMRLGYESERGKCQVTSMLESIKYSLKELEQTLYKRR